MAGPNDGSKRITEQDVLAALRGVKDPDLGRDLVDLGMIKNIKVADGRLSLMVELTTPACPLKGKIEQDVRAALARELPQVREVEVTMGANVRGKAFVQKEDIVGIKNIFAVGSGKGGVGKSTVAAAIAFGLKSYGAQVGLMDADVYGPSQPHLLGITGYRPMAREVLDAQGNRKQQILPIEVDGLKAISIGLMVQKGEAMIVRGPILHQIMNQFLRDVDWGELDYLVIDLPPTTGDVPLSLSQLIPMTGGVIVCTPQDVALIDAERAVAMFRKLKVPILGVIENMSHFDCPHCGQRTDIFGTGGARQMAEREGLPFLGEIPINLQIRTRGDAGQIAALYHDDSPVRPHLLHICEQLAAQISIQNIQQPKLPKLEVIGG